MATIDEIAAALHKHLVDCPLHGYTQGPGRWGDGSWCSIVLDGKTHYIHGGDRDCSSSVSDAWQRALIGTEYQGKLDGATWTGDMKQVFLSSGLFDWHPMGDGYIAQPGDVYLRHNWSNGKGHTAMCQSVVPDKLTEFWSNEWGGSTGGVPGDQTGWESRERYYYDFPWDGILAYNHKADGEEFMPTVDEIAKAVWSRDIKGVKAGERLYLDNKQLFDREDYSERGRDGYTIVERVCYLADKLDKIQDKLDEIDRKLGDDDGK